MQNEYSDQPGGARSVTRAVARPTLVKLRALAASLFLPVLGSLVLWSYLIIINAVIIIVSIFASFVVSRTVSQW